MVLHAAPTGELFAEAAGGAAIADHVARAARSGVLGVPPQFHAIDDRVVHGRRSRGDVGGGLTAKPAAEASITSARAGPAEARPASIRARPTASRIDGLYMHADAVPSCGGGASK